VWWFEKVGQRVEKNVWYKPQVTFQDGTSSILRSVFSRDGTKERGRYLKKNVMGEVERKLLEKGRGQSI